MRLKFWRKGSERDKVNQGNIDDIMNRIHVIRLRLSNRIKEMNLRYREIFEQVVRAHVERDSEKAALYAQEIAELRKILRKLTKADILLEGVAYRLEAVKDLKDVGTLISPMKSLLSQAGDELSGVAPTISEGIKDLIDSIEDLSIRAGSVPEMGSVGTGLSDEARKILEEASMIASQRRRKNALEDGMDSKSL
ncbi:MAG: hypothetical protein RMI78_05165 [Nitrososphaerota archaeon]|nr:hypothetical protein [Nitrososphaerota archaeon]